MALLQATSYEPQTVHREFRAKGHPTTITTHHRGGPVCPPLRRDK